MRIAVVLIAVAMSLNVVAQRVKGPEFYYPKSGTVCYAKAHDEFANIAPPQEYLRAQRGQARTKAANIIVTYEGFTSDAQAAFQEAVDIWASLIQTPITIRIQARWAPLGAGVLGSASPGTYVRNFEGAQKNEVWYPVALAEKLSGKDLNSPSDPDIVASFNSSNSSWHFGLTGTSPPAGKYDLISIVLHEIGHGLGLTHAYTVEGGTGLISEFFLNRPVIFETAFETDGGVNMVNGFTPPSADLKTAITGEILFYSSPLVKSVNSGFNAQIYAPATYSAGSSISHLDEAIYPAGNSNSLMTPFIASAERNLNPGPIVRAMLKDMGWSGTTIKHTALKNTESSTGPYRVIAKMVSDDGYTANTVTLNYKTTGSFAAIPMTPTANADEFSADLPLGAASYSYFISVKDADNRIFTTPGTLVKPGANPSQRVLTFAAGPDTKAPTVTHTPKEFITASDPLELQAFVNDGLGVEEVKIEWKLKGVAMPDELFTLKANTDSVYNLKLTFTPALSVGDKIEYRIVAKDKAIAGNLAFKPSASTFYEVNVTGLAGTVDSYSNNFDNLSSADFFGNGFTISKPTGFSDGAIHTDHPYAEGGAAGVTLSLIYNLKNPIRINGSESILKFDEIVLVEPGEAGKAWPDADFYDYVVVEGSKDGGLNWIAIADGYDSRENGTWLSLWNGSITNNNSTATGEPSLYKPHQFNLLSKFKADEEVAIRFRLYSDPFSRGWGWSIDNLKIQIDDTAPVISHQHTDYFLPGGTSFIFNSTVNDAFGVKQVFVDYNVNGGTTSTLEIVNPVGDQYSQTIDLTSLALKAGDEFQYKIRASDNNGNLGSYPTTGYFKVAVVAVGAGASSVSSIVSDFSTASADLTGNFFTASQASGFTSPAMNSPHPYSAMTGGLDYSFLTKKPVKITSSNPFLYYEDVAIVEYPAASVRDYVVVEGSKDGITWDPIVPAYAAHTVSAWKAAFDAGGAGTQGMLQKHNVNLTSSGKFKDGDNILIRFRLHSDNAVTGWGWLVDNLSIQGPVTGLEKTNASGLVAWPNPVTGDVLNLGLALPEPSHVSVEIFSTHGQLISSDGFTAPRGDYNKEYPVRDWAEGVYLLRVKTDFGTTVRKIVKLR